MSWLGQNGASREDFASLADAYASMYQAAEEADEATEVLQEDEQELEEGIGKVLSSAAKAVAGKAFKGHMRGKSSVTRANDPGYPRGSGKDGMKREEVEILDALQDAYAMMYEKKKDSDKCGEGTYWDSEDKKCKKKKSSSKTVIVGRGGYYGGGHHHGGSNGGDGETDGGETDGGTDGGGDGGGGGE